MNMISNEQSFQESVMDPILQSIRSYPENNAVCSNDKYYTYRQLGEYIDKARLFIRKQNINNRIVGIVDNSDFETYATAFALWMEGYCFVPLQSNWPIERCVDIVNTSGVNTIFDTSIKTKYVDYNVINTNRAIDSGETPLERQQICDSDLACILFTSGSTGIPKGVKISRKNIAAAIDSFWNTGLSIVSSDRCLQCLDMSFAVSLQTVITPLQKGACIYSIPSGQIKYAYSLALIDKYSLSICTMVYSMAILVLPYLGKINHAQIKSFMVFGEPCRTNTLAELQNTIPNSELFVFYGATETTIHVTCNQLRKNKLMSHNGILSVGKPLKNVKILICDEDDCPVPTNHKGELCVGGDQVSNGYVQSEKSTNTAFFTKVIDGETVRFYRTGDFAYLTDNGCLYVCGRLNNMVKILGNRVELNEIEYVADEYLHEIKVICLPLERNDYLTTIIMFIESIEFPINGLVEYLKKKLPPYMIPDKFLFIKEFPYNFHGKIDRKKLMSIINE